MINQQGMATYTFGSCKMDCLFNAGIQDMERLYAGKRICWLVDEKVLKAHASLFEDKQILSVASGEETKTQLVADELINGLIRLNADRGTVVVGVGGGVTTDITGYVASVYMRGLSFAFVPTTVLAMVDAAVGGKNGINVGVYKNMVGLINHPQKIAYDLNFLSTLPETEWISGFAEVIKHACIKDASLFSILESRSLKDFRDDEGLMRDLVHRNVDIKTRVVASDEREANDRRLLNFGHTIGHAIEKTSGLPHGYAISIGMVLAAKISINLSGLKEEDVQRISALLMRYDLPVTLEFDKEIVWSILLHDKKLAADEIHFITLKNIGQGQCVKISLEKLRDLFFGL